MTEIQLPYYLQFTIKLIMILLIGTFIYLGQDILVPLAFSTLLAIVLLPFTNFLERKKIPKTFANLIAVITALIIVGGILYFFSFQITKFLRDIPSIKTHLTQHYNAMQNWMQQKLHISNESQTTLFNNAAEKVKDSGTMYIRQTFLTITQMIFLIALITVYTFFILYYRHTIRKFIIAVFKKAHTPKVNEVLTESKNIIQKYIIGLLIEMVIVAIAISAVLLIIGVKYAIFFGVLTAILNIIPYIGFFICIGFTVLVTLTTTDQLNSIIWIIVGMEAVHFADANFLMPNVVGSKVKINALVTIISALIGATLVGISGIFLALPTIAILKIIFDRVDGLKPWGEMMGEEKRTKIFSRKVKHVILNKPAVKQNSQI
ncbi:MAG: AI-2E family transporter, partial [Ferruginibacter sp.]